MNNQDVLKIPVFLTKIKGVSTIVKNNGLQFEIYQGKNWRSLSYVEFFQNWDNNEIISPFICNVWYECKSVGNATGTIKIIYSYHDVESEKLLKAVETILGEAKEKPPFYVDELGLIPYETIKNYMELYKLDEKQAFEKCKEMLKGEVENVGEGISIYDPNSTYNALYRFLADHKVKSTMEDLKYENWKEIVKFDALGTNILAQEYFLRGEVDNYIKFKKLYCFGFWEFNVKRRDQNFLEQLINLIKTYPDYTIFTVRGIGHFGLEEKLAKNGVNVQFILLGDGQLEENLINQQIMQVYFNHHIKLSKENIFRMILESQIEELLRLYFYRKGQVTSTATKACKTLLRSLRNEDIFEIFREVKEKIDEDFPQHKLPDLIYELIKNLIKR
jgi:hypothetical protein